jgi:hypothetical protein
VYTPIDMKQSMKFGSEYWEVFSPKINRIAKFFSDLEYDHRVLVVTNPFIKTFCEQPLRIKQKINGKFVVSIIDMWVLYEDDAECFVEVKYANDAVSDERSKNAIGAQKLWCQENGFFHSFKPFLLSRIIHIMLTRNKKLLH